VLRKEYFDCPQRDSHAVHYIHSILWKLEWGLCLHVKLLLLHQTLKLLP
jgi:hypothetical protein